MDFNYICIVGNYLLSCLARGRLPLHGIAALMKICISFPHWEIVAGKFCTVIIRSD